MIYNLALSIPARVPAHDEVRGETHAGPDGATGPGYVPRLRAVPDRLERGREGAVLDLRRSPLPESGVAVVLRHRRLVADLRSHVPAVRHAVRVGLDRQGSQRLRVHGRDPSRSVNPRRSDRVPGTLRAARPA